MLTKHYRRKIEKYLEHKVDPRKVTKGVIYHIYTNKKYFLFSDHKKYILHLFLFQKNCLESELKDSFFLRKTEKLNKNSNLIRLDTQSKPDQYTEDTKLPFDWSPLESTKLWFCC